MVPLDSVLEKRPAERKTFLPPAKPQPRKPRPPEPRKPRRFRVIDVTTREVLADDASARETVDVLGTVRSNVDVNVFVWAEKAQTWRLLSLAEPRALWDRRRVPA
jgi:hypothetical protein